MVTDHVTIFMFSKKIIITRKTSLCPPPQQCGMAMRAKIYLKVENINIVSVELHQNLTKFYGKRMPSFFAILKYLPLVRRCEKKQKE